MSERERIKALVDRVPDKYLEATERILSALTIEEPVCVSIDDAPEDDEPLTQEDIEAEAEADRAIAEGRVSSHEEVMRRLGLTGSARS